ncbi:MAG: 50S ribosomal protein L15 [bacterium]
MKLHELKPQPGEKSAKKRVGRGIGSGLGKTSGRGHKGQKSRSGGSVRPGFEGGQKPLQLRLPKRGFKNIFRKEYGQVNVQELNRFQTDTIVTPEVLVETGLIKKNLDGVKILGHGELEKSLVVRAHSFSKSAVEKITAAGGRAEVI